MNYSKGELKRMLQNVPREGWTTQKIKDLIDSLYPSDVNITSLAAEKVIPDTTNFANVLSENEVNVQLALEKLDSMIVTDVVCKGGRQTA